jgi:cell division protein FtsQ
MKVFLKKRYNKKKISGREKMAKVFKKAVLAISVITISLFFLHLYQTISGLEIFKVREIEIKGNYHLSRESLLNMTDIKRDSILKISLNDLRTKILKSPWIKDAVAKREIPGTIRIEIKERFPEAIIDYGDSFYLVDGEGVIIERVSDRKGYSLPVVSGIDLSENRLGERINSKGLSEGLTLIKFLRDKGIGLNDIELVANNPEDLILNLPGKQIKVGSGNYKEKFNRLDDIEAELKRKGVLASSIDIRFSGKVIVIPMAESNL